MFNQHHFHRLVGAITFAVSLSACGGADDQSSSDSVSSASAQSTNSPPVRTASATTRSTAASALKATRYSVFKFDNGQPFGLPDAGLVSNTSANGGYLDLGNGAGTDLTVAGVPTSSIDASNDAFQVFGRLDGSILMLCGTAESVTGSQGRYAAIATSATSNEMAAAPVYYADELAGKHFYEVTGCAYRSGSSVQAGAHSHNALTNSLTVAANGDVVVSRGTAAPPSTVGAEDFTSLLHGVWSSGPRYSAFKFNRGGVASYVLVERTSPDELDRTNGVLTVWLPD